LRGTGELLCPRHEARHQSARAQGGDRIIPRIIARRDFGGFGAPPRLQLHGVGRPPNEAELVYERNAFDATVGYCGMEGLIGAAAAAEHGQIANTALLQPVDCGGDIIAERAVE
jgi:hypothetical protein